MMNTEKPIGIITAMKCEAKYLLEIANIRETRFVGGQKFYVGKIKSNEVVISVCGVGKVFAAICTQTMLTELNCGHIINIGVAGALANEVEINDIVLAKDVVQYDMDTSALGDPVGMISGIDIVNIPCDTDRLYHLKKAADTARFINHIGTIATGDRFFNDEKTRAYVADKFGAYAGEMEGAAVGQVCFVNNVPFNVVRIISDKAGENSSVEYGNNVKTAAKKLSELIRVYFE